MCVLLCKVHNAAINASVTERTSMGQKRLVRVAKCQLLVSCLFIMLLALAVFIVTVMTGWQSHFIVLTRVSPTESPVKGLHHIMLVYGGSVCALLLIIALLSFLSILRESHQFMGIAFLVFGFLFCVLIAGMTWIYDCQSQVDVSFLNVYDSLYEQVLRRSPDVQREHLLYIHETVQCCGKINRHASLPETSTMCEPEEERQDCVSMISDALHIHWTWVRTLHLLGLMLTLAGGVILGVALWLRHEPETSKLLLQNIGDKQAPGTFYIGIYIVIAVGAVMMFVGFLGCYGAIQESQCLLGTFFTCLVILFACEVAAGIWGFVHRDQVTKEVKQFYDEAYQQAMTGDQDHKTKALSVLKAFHETLRCCGSSSMMKVATTILNKDICPGQTIIDKINVVDCHSRIENVFSTKLYLVGIAAVVVAVIMIIEMIFSMVLCCGIRISSVY